MSAHDSTTVSIIASLVALAGVLLTYLSNKRDRAERKEASDRAERAQAEAARRAEEAENRKQDLSALDVTNQRLATENTRLDARARVAEERTAALEVALVEERDKTERARRNELAAADDMAALVEQLARAHAHSGRLIAVLANHGLDVPE